MRLEPRKSRPNSTTNGVALGVTLFCTPWQPFYSRSVEQRNRLSNSSFSLICTWAGSTIYLIRHEVSCANTVEIILLLGIGRAWCVFPCDACFVSGPECQRHFWASFSCSPRPRGAVATTRLMSSGRPLIISKRPRTAPLFHGQMRFPRVNPVPAPALPAAVVLSFHPLRFPSNP
jgi:hypothetical protein